MLKNTRGMTIFVAVLVVSMLSLAVFSVTNIALKQILISGSLKSSQQAYFAADAGLQCAYAHDFHQYVSNDIPIFTATANEPMKCSGAEVVWDDYTGSDSMSANIYDDCFGLDPKLGSKIEKSFHFEIKEDGRSVCAKTTVKKICAEDNLGHVVKTVIDSRGYNVACDDTDNPRAVERFVWMNQP